MTKKDIQERTLNFSIRIVNLCKFLRQKGVTPQSGSYTEQAAFTDIQR
jgi:hypothetical protein